VADGGSWRRRGFLVVALVVSALVTTAAPASAVATFVPGASINKSYCTSQTAQLAWWGGNNNGVHPDLVQPKGSMYLCYYKYRIADSDSSGDYWAMSVETYWTLRDGEADYPAVMYQNATSNLSARSNVYTATPSFTSNTSCNSSLSFTVSAGPIGATVRPRVCSGYRVNRYGYGPTQALYTSTSAGGLRKVETVYLQKVANGAVPRFTVSVAIPRYTHTWNGLYWKQTAKLTWLSYTGV
jgi:hypothetical protein